MAQTSPERSEIDVAGLDDHRARGWILANLDTLGPDLLQIVVDGPAGAGGGRERQSGGQMILHGIGRSAAAHDGAQEMDWPSGGGRRPHPGGDELGLRRQDHLQAVLGFALGIEDENVLRAGANVDSKDASVPAAVVRTKIGHSGECR